LYPSTEYSVEANQLISELQEKLEQKDFEIAKQYFTIRDYKAAIKASDNFIASFPGTKYREEALYTKFNASYQIATNSIFSLKKQRLAELQQQFDIILRYYPETVFLNDLENKMIKVNSELEKTQPTISKLSK
jgi:outer membrane protein assembly factor BamD